MVYVVLVLFALALVALGAWAARRPGPTDSTLPCSTDRLGIREPRVEPYGPPSGL